MGTTAIANEAEPKLDKMFDSLRNPSEDDKDALGVESTMKYLTSLGLNPESGEIFVALELVRAPTLGEITRKGFVDGWKAKYVTFLKAPTVLLQVCEEIRKIMIANPYFFAAAT